MKKFLTDNMIVWAYILLTIFFELFGVFFSDCLPILTKPWFSLLLLCVIVSILLLTANKTAQLVICSIFLILQCAVIVGFVFLYDSNGTVFEWSMLNQRNDAFGTIEDYSMQTKFIYPAVVLITAFIAGGSIFVSKSKKFKKNRHQNSRTLKTILLSALISASALSIGLPLSQEIKSKRQDYSSILYANTGSCYQEMGIFPNALYQLLKGSLSFIYNNISIDTKTVDNYIYSEKLAKSEYNGTSAENNLILILVESFEWYPLTMYPELTETLYPNLSKFMEESVVFDNFYSREKTNTAEALAVLGNYPTGKFVHYDFYKNAYPFSLPNLFRADATARGQTAKINSFHQNNGVFYNRFTAHKAFGFDKLFGIQDMVNYGVTNTWWGNLHERNLDSETIEKMKDTMFPADELFFSFWITFSMHGFYEDRVLFEDYYEVFDSLNVFPKTNNKKANYLRTYAAAVMDFDKSIGLMMEDLESKNLLGSTTIAMLSDHNTYYSNLAYYAKNITEKYNSELYRVPFMIYDQKLTDKMKANGQSTTISKFTTTADVLPTLLDLLGIDGWKNLYFGTSAFIPDIESVIYSRAYGIFVTDKLICYSLKNVLFKAKGFSAEDKRDFEARAKLHLKKLEHVDKIYYSNYFAKHTYKTA